MERISYDLHIHSCLSPCGDSDMTPGNIVGMAAVKGLDVIALTDHNSCRNCGPFMKIAEQFGIMAIPGMEITTAEEVHVVCLFPTLDRAEAYGRYVYDKLIQVPNQPDIFGEQEIVNEEDAVIGTEPNLLINATMIMFDEVYAIVKEFDGVMIPAHMDKNANSLISNLGFVPEQSLFTCAELKDMKHWHGVKALNPYLEKCNVITNSDAHYLEHIHEPVNYLTVKEKSVKGVLEALEIT